MLRGRAARGLEAEDEDVSCAALPLVVVVSVVVACDSVLGSTGTFAALCLLDPVAAAAAVRLPRLDSRVPSPSNIMALNPG